LTARIRACEARPGWQNVAKPEPPEGGEAVTVCYAMCVVIRYLEEEKTAVLYCRFTGANHGQKPKRGSLGCNPYEARKDLK